MPPNSDDSEDPEPSVCPVCGEALAEHEQAGREPGVMVVYNVTCAADCGQMGLTIPLDDVQKAAQRFQQRQQGRHGHGRGGRRR